MNYRLLIILCLIGDLWFLDECALQIPELKKCFSFVCLFVFIILPCIVLLVAILILFFPLGVSQIVPFP